ncbi:hypothetical protein KP509_14G026500 [Ceratopteris richardii]|uniref:EamA domain-containing protein n=1 Tax=Ceratopteris richardii TaxID=49495 RepID=A0A8T2TBH7_CERRI|nr:hypothetical protein KP509_14G026500 [Ceratopteris richardii]KAH7415084.1 hypothetical protein KP509_14G026500 [Ceratopteris richardii]
MRKIGFAFAAIAAIGNSCIDGSRKFASQRFSAIELIGLVGLLDAVFLAVIVIGSGYYSSFDTSVVASDINFLRIVIISAGIKVLAGFLYQRALHLSPLSVTVPYLAFTPALLLFTSYAMMHEEPSYQGLLGVVVVTIGGYLLAIEQPSDTEAKGEKPKARFWNSLFLSLLSMLSKWHTAALSGKDRTFLAADTDKGFVVVDRERWDDQADTVNVSVLAVTKDEQLIPRSNSHGRKDWNILERIVEPFHALKREPGSLLMLGVAGLLSISSSLDKMGAHLAPSPLVYAALQKVIMAIPVTLFLGLMSPSSFRHIFGQFHVLFAISSFEVLAFVSYLKSLETLLVAYSIAAKRSNVLISVFIGSLVFKEKILRRLPFILLMIGGMALIVFS